MIIDFHIHTNFSPDSRIELEELIEVVLDRGLAGVAICDHNTIEGAKRLKKIAPFLVIVGEEIKTEEGEIIGYFLEEEIPPYQSLEETVGMIKEQGGLVCIPHPFDRLRRSRLPLEAVESIKEEIDLVEGYNSRNVFEEDNLKAVEWAEKNKKLVVAGSDAHTYSEVGKAYVELPEFSNPDGLRRALKEATVYGKKSWFWVHLYTIAKKRLGGKSGYS